MSENLVSRLLAHASARPRDEAIVDERKTVTYGELARRVLGAAARLDALGVRAGDTVALSFGASREHAVDFTSALYGAGYLGAAILPLYPDVPEGRRRDLVGTFGARWSVAAQSEDWGASSLLLGEICDKSHISAREPPRGDAGALPFFYQFSSGTTGNPKAMLFTHAQLFAGMSSIVTHYGWNRGQRLVPATAAPSKVGLRYLFQVLLSGGTLVNLPFPDTHERMERAIADFGVDAAGGSPWQLRRLLQSPAGRNSGLPPLRFLAAIGAMISAEEIRAIRATITPNLHVPYGSTECGLIALLRPQDDAAGGFTLAAGLEVEIVDGAGARRPSGETGLVRLRAPWMPDRYIDNPAETAKRFRGGWFYPGDAGHLDGAGRIFVHGRSDEAINYGGTKILPEEIEAALVQHPDIDDVGVTSLPDPMAGEVPVALAVLRRPTTQASLQAFCLAHIDALSIPAGFVFVGQLPRSADGKLDRVRLREQARSLAHIDHSTKP